MTDPTHTLATKIWDSLYDVIHTERPTQDVLLEALAVTVGHCVVCSVTAHERRQTSRDLGATIERYVSVVSGRMSEAGATR